MFRLPGIIDLSMSVKGTSYMQRSVCEASACTVIKVTDCDTIVEDNQHGIYCSQSELFFQYVSHKREKGLI